MDCSNQTIEDQSNDQCGSVIDDTLWVDKYRPRRFTDLVGNEKVARDALAWVKQWDYCVFGKTKGKNKNWRNEDMNEDKYRRPPEKASSLCFRFCAVLLKRFTLDSFVVGTSWSR